MLRWSTVSLLLIISIKWESCTVHGFLFTPKFQIFLNQLRQNQANQQFVVNWDFNNNYSLNKNGFSYAASLNGMFMKQYYSLKKVCNHLLIILAPSKDRWAVIFHSRVLILVMRYAISMSMTSNIGKLVETNHILVLNLFNC